MDKNIPTMHVSIFSLDATLYNGEALSFTAQGVEGSFEVWPQHTSFMTILAMGPLVIRVPNEEQAIFFISGGVMHVLDGKITVLVDEAHRAHDLDEVAAQKARQKALDALQNQHEHVNYSEVLREIALAREQLRVIRMSKKNG